MNKTVYNYHPQTGEFINEVRADESPLEPGVILIPAFATTAKPPKTVTREVAVFADGKWRIKADWRYISLFSTADGSAVTIGEIGKTPADVGATDQPMPSSAHAWTNGSWQLDPVKQAAQFDRAKLQALATIDQFHAETVQKLVGNPTQVERDTWELKLEVANAITGKAAVGATGQAFLVNAGIATDTARSAWAASVLARWSAYAQVIGLAEKLRNTARTAVKAATDEASLKAALDAQRAAADAAVAHLLKGA
jgi:hypothetical protein